MILEEHVMEEMSAEPSRFDLISEYEKHRAFSLATFGPGPRLNGVLAHLAKEMDEVRKDPTDVDEWIDLMILSLDGAWRNTGLPIHVIVSRFKAKLEKIRRRSYPDWRTVGQDAPIEHVRGIED